MGWYGDITGKNALAKMDLAAAEMEQVYAAFATRMIEILDKEERLDATQRALVELLNRFDGTRWHDEIERLRGRVVWAYLMAAGSIGLAGAALALAL